MASGSRDRLSHLATPPPLLHRGDQPAEFPQPGARALSDRVQKGGRLGDRPAPADEAAAASVRSVGSASRSPKPTAG